VHVHAKHIIFIIQSLRHCEETRHCFWGWLMPLRIPLPNLPLQQNKMDDIVLCVRFLLFIVKQSY